MSSIVILGSSFAALRAVKTLRQAGCTSPITLIAPRPTLFFYPSLIWVPSGLRNEQDLTIPLDKFFARYQVTYQTGTVTGLDPVAHIVQTDKNTFAFDGLIIGSGGQFIKKLQGLEHSYLPCGGFQEIKAYTDKLNALEKGTLTFGFSANPKEPSAVRGGPVFEFLLGIDTLLRQQGRRDKFKLIFFNPSTTPGQRLGGKAVTALLAEMAKRGIETHLGHKMQGFTANKVLTEGGEIASDLTLFMPGMTGPAWAEASGLPLSEGGFIKANEKCQVSGFEKIYIAGDGGSYVAPDWLPKQAHMAELQATTAAKNLLLEMAGKTPTHTFKHELVCIVDSLNQGMLVFRNDKQVRLLSPNRLLHWAKRIFEYWYLRQYR
ncbi:NAD(P)/FAD-dependent oxidoreductase [Beggiatoa leptomitoformis]|uniref:NAD(P)/FAD-dependent oxidoreductase n=1 Tax=Beggiatoa leptomitoformis TaxID=288004 RepID=A0A2N9YET1_9GAMM|nr:FAD-dependent oxidoreductase [Beggiatoa leptomitoformis]ALG68656.1 NAD(P)/FAD-dependent oxidoreductase [Beggiatoa leptomitoformis]AUI68992.1 NAD(P)/FAD-dependent oxidoreductase [Beggiatoa leptomitoformis]